MTSFKGFDDWVEIFRGGKQIDSNGHEHDGDAIIDKAIATFNASAHEPPVVVGHPKDNAPAFGWVEDLKKSGNTLLAKIKNVVPEFQAAVEKGLYKKRSASFYPDGRLRHVGFLGAAPPAVKGLADIGFEDGENQTTFEFGETNPWTWQAIADVFRRLREWIIEKEGKDAADGIIGNWDVSTIEDEKTNSQAKNKEEEIMAYTEEQLQAKLNQQKTEFAEKLEAEKKLAADAALKKANADFAEKTKLAAREARGKEITAFCGTLLTQGKIIPAWAKSGLAEFMQNLDAENVVEFSEGKKTSALDWFKNFIEELPKVVEFKEIASRDKDIGAGDAGGKLEKLTRNKMAEKKIDYSAAFAEVQTEHPDLVTEYRTEMTA